MGGRLWDESPDGCAPSSAVCRQRTTLAGLLELSARPTYLACRPGMSICARRPDLVGWVAPGVDPSPLPAEARWAGDFAKWRSSQRVRGSGSSVNWEGGDLFLLQVSSTLWQLEGEPDVTEGHAVREAAGGCA